MVPITCPFTWPQFHHARDKTSHPVAETSDFIGQAGCGAIFLLQKTDYFNKLQA
jgi:hypothetical protein